MQISCLAHLYYIAPKYQEQFSTSWKEKSTVISMFLVFSGFHLRGAGALKDARANYWRHESVWWIDLEQMYALYFFLIILKWIESLRSSKEWQMQWTMLCVTSKSWSWLFDHHWEPLDAWKEYLPVTRGSSSHMSFRGMYQRIYFIETVKNKLGRQSGACKREQLTYIKNADESMDVSEALMEWS